MEAPTPAPRTVLLVEPERPASPADYFRRHGYEVVRRSRPADAFGLLSGSSSFDAVLCDDSFHPSAVRALFDAARRRNPLTIAAVVAPDSAVEDADLAQAFSADRVVRIPVRHRRTFATPQQTG